MKNHTSTKTETPTNEPCPVCGREEEGNWFTPCPSDDCPSHDTMKKQYRVNVPAIVAFYVAAESEEQAKRIAAAATYTPVEPMFTNGTWENHGFESAGVIGLTIWAATYDQDGTIGGIDSELTGKAVEVIDVNSASEDEILDLEQGVREFAAFNSNEEELAAALK